MLAFLLATLCMQSGDAPASGAPPAPGNRFALVIGNDDYQNFSKLECAVRDAKAIAEVLEDDYGFKVTPLYNATWWEIRKVLSALTASLVDEDQLIIYFAGHGLENKSNKRGFWLGVDSEDGQDTQISNSYVKDCLSACSARQILVIVDSCFAATLTRDTEDYRGVSIEASQSERPEELRRRSQRKTRMALTSGGLEPVSDSTSGGHSPFASALLFRLRENDDLLEGHRLFSDIRFEVTERTRALAKEQTPVYGEILGCDHDPAGDFVFRRIDPRQPEVPKTSSTDRASSLLIGRILGPDRQRIKISLTDGSYERTVFAGEQFELPLRPQAGVVELEAKIGDYELDRREFALGEPEQDTASSGRGIPRFHLGDWEVAELPCYLEGTIMLPKGVHGATVRAEVAAGLSTRDANWILEQDVGTEGEFQLRVPHRPGSIDLVISAPEIPERRVRADFGRSQGQIRDNRWVPVVDLREIELSAPDYPVEPLLDRAAYAGLDEEEVRSLAGAAAMRWPMLGAAMELSSVERFESGGAAHWISIWRHRVTGLEFVLLPGGAFQMGSPAEELGHTAAEKQHPVTLSPFLISRTECTGDAWLRGRGEKPSGDRLPRTSVSSSEALAWCQRTGLALPTEAQWEFACRAGTATPFSFGAQASELSSHGNVASRESDPRLAPEAWSDGYGDTAAPVASFAPSAFGIHDMHGNVAEWCRDRYLYYHKTEPLPGTGERTGDSKFQVLRGGHFGSSAYSARSSARAQESPHKSDRYIGFRPVLDLPW